jgi:hypothetical protein
MRNLIFLATLVLSSFAALGQQTFDSATPSSVCQDTFSFSKHVTVLDQHSSVAVSTFVVASNSPLIDSLVNVRVSTILATTRTFLNPALSLIPGGTDIPQPAKDAILTTILLIVGAVVRALEKKALTKQLYPDGHSG